MHQSSLNRGLDRRRKTPGDRTGPDDDRLPLLYDREKSEFSSSWSCFAIHATTARPTISRANQNALWRHGQGRGFDDQRHSPSSAGRQALRTQPALCPPIQTRTASPNPAQRSAEAFCEGGLCFGLHVGYLDRASRLASTVAHTLRSSGATRLRIAMIWLAVVDVPGPESRESARMQQPCDVDALSTDYAS